jgi:hypothetical protein
MTNPTRTLDFPKICLIKRRSAPCLSLTENRKLFKAGRFPSMVENILKTLEEKVAKSKSVIQEALDRYGDKMALAWTGGKDSPPPCTCCGKWGAAGCLFRS